MGSCLHQVPIPWSDQPISRSGSHRQSTSITTDAFNYLTAKLRGFQVSWGRNGRVTLMLSLCLHALLHVLALLQIKQSPHSLTRHQLQCIRTRIRTDHTAFVCSIHMLPTQHKLQRSQQPHQVNHTLPRVWIDILLQNLEACEASGPDWLDTWLQGYMQEQ